MVNEEIELSKNQRKLHMKQLQLLGMQLLTLNQTQLEQCNLPDILLKAIIDAKKITAHGAIRRHRQYIGKLMRTINTDNIKHKIATFI